MTKISKNRTRPYTSDNPDPLDVEVGRRLRTRRKTLGLSQQQLADAVGITFQQVQKYERGLNRLSASRIWDFSCILGTSVSFFFEDLDGVDINRTVPRAQKDAEKLSFISGVEDPGSRAETLELCYAFWAASPSVRHAFVEFIKICAEAGHQATPSAQALMKVAEGQTGGGWISTDPIGLTT